MTGQSGRICQRNSNRCAPAATSNVSLTKFNKDQLGKYADLSEQVPGRVEYVIRNGQVSKPFKQYAVELNARLNANHGTTNVKWVDLLDDFGQSIM